MVPYFGRKALSRLLLVNRITRLPLAFESEAMASPLAECGCCSYPVIKAVGLEYPNLNPGFATSQL